MASAWPDRSERRSIHTEAVFYDVGRSMRDGSLVPGSCHYCVQVNLFQDSNGDGCGDLRGLISRLDYLSHLGITCLWLNPIHPSPLRDGGYDVADFYGVHPRLGSLGDFADLTLRAAQRGVRIVLD